jgi:prepilin peptidase CpaA
LCLELSGRGRLAPFPTLRSLLASFFMPIAEYNALLELLGALFVDWRISTLMALMLLAAVFDVRSHRIPNRLVLIGIVAGCLCNWILPAHTLRQGVLFPIEGLAVGFALFVPLYLLRAMGAGDVKLMAMVGAFVGPHDALFAALVTMIVGGALAIGYVIVNGTAARLYSNLLSFFYGSVLGVMGGVRPDVHIDASASAGKLPYAVSIALGTTGYLVLHQLGLI